MHGGSIRLRLGVVRSHPEEVVLAVAAGFNVLGALVLCAFLAIDLEDELHLAKVLVQELMAVNEDLAGEPVSLRAHRHVLVIGAEPHYLRTRDQDVRFSVGLI